jgi:glucose-6-phosphate isomerase
MSLETSQDLSPVPPPNVAIDLSRGTLSGTPIERTQRRMRDLANLFADEEARSRFDPSTLVYSVEIFAPVPECTDGGLFFGATFIEPGLVGNEYFMTKGHFHQKRAAAEYYWCVKGWGILLLMDEERHCRVERMSPGSLHYIPGCTAHRVANVGEEQLCFGACWPADAGHDYDAIAQHGFAARVLEINGKSEVVGR